MRGRFYLYPFVFSLLLPAVSFSQGRRVPVLSKPVVVESAAAFGFRIAEDDQGGFYIAWTHEESGTYALFAQHVDSMSVVRWSESGVEVADHLPDTENWDMSADGKGGLLLTWEENAHIHARRFDADHQTLWPDSESIVSDSTNTQTSPTCTPDGSGGAFIIWQEKRFSDRWVLVGQHVNAIGVLLWRAEGPRISLRPSDQRRPAAAADGRAGVLVAWKDFRENASQLQTQRLDYQGTLMWGEQGSVVTAPASEMTKPPIMAATGNGGEVLAWVGSSEATNRVLTQAIAPDGKLAWNPQGQAASSQPGDEENPVVCGDSHGGGWIGWEDYRDQNRWQLYLQHFTASGQAAWTSGEIALAPNAAYQNHLVLTEDGHDGVWAAWIDDRSGNPGVYAQTVDPARHLLLGSQGQILAEGLVKPSAPQIALLSPGRTVVSWADQENKGQWTLSWRLAGAPALIDHVDGKELK